MPRATKRALTPYLQFEFDTIAAMTKLYCQAHHAQQQAPCEACSNFLAFAEKKLALCPYGDNKPACSKCPIHCYGQKKRLEAIEIMRFAGPRMLLRHPLMALRHLLQKRKPVPKA